MAFVRSAGRSRVCVTATSEIIGRSRAVAHKGRASPTGFGYGFCFLGLTIQ
jgi:hypothetical protein